MLAASQGHSKSIDALLKIGAKIDTQNNAGETALILAAHNGDRNSVYTLLKNGANTRVRNKFKKRAEDIAMIAGQTEISELIKTTRKENWFALF